MSDCRHEFSGAHTIVAMCDLCGDSDLDIAEQRIAELKQKLAELREAAKEACIEMGCFCDDEDVGSDVCVMCRLEQALQGGDKDDR